MQAEAKNDTDFLTQSALGHLYLYGLNEDCNVIDLAKAEQHFRNAARYAKPEIQHLPEARKYCGEAYLHASIACYAQAHEQQQRGDQTTAQKLLQNAATLAKQATDIYPQLSEGFYQHAKVQALLGDAPPAVGHAFRQATCKFDRTFKCYLVCRVQPGRTLFSVRK